MNFSFLWNFVQKSLPEIAGNIDFKVKLLSPLLMHKGLQNKEMDQNDFMMDIHNVHHMHLST